MYIYYVCFDAKECFDVTVIFEEPIKKSIEIY